MNSISITGLDTLEKYTREYVPSHPQHPELLHFDPSRDAWIWRTAPGPILLVEKNDFTQAVRNLIYSNHMHADEATVAVMHPWYWLGDDYVRLKPE